MPGANLTTPKKRSPTSDNKSANFKASPEAHVTESATIASAVPESPPNKKENVSVEIAFAELASKDFMAVESEGVERVAIEPEGVKCEPVEPVEPNFNEAEPIAAKHVHSKPAQHEHIDLIEPKAADFEPVEPERIELEYNVSDTEPESIVPKTLEPRINEPEAAETDPVDSEPAESAEPERNELESMVPETASETIVPQTLKHNSVEDKSLIPEPIDSEFVEPQSLKLGSTKPEFVEAETIIPKPIDPEFEEPEPLEPEFIEPSIKPVSAEPRTSEATFNGTIFAEPPLTLVESLQNAGVQESALSTFLPSNSSMQLADARPMSAGPHDASDGEPFSAANVGLGTARRLVFGKYLNSQKPGSFYCISSAGNSPVTPQPATFPKYHYPDLDVLTPENKEILDLAIKGECSVKQPKSKVVPVVEPVFSTKSVIYTYDGKDAHEVLGDRCPRPLTLADHPHLNKCVQEGHNFSCAFCKVSIPATMDVDGPVICPGCGPCSEVRYCSKSHLLSDILEHYHVCGTQPGNYPLAWDKLPRHYALQYPYIKPVGHKMTQQCFKQMAFCLNIDSDGAIEAPYKSYYEVSYRSDPSAPLYSN